MKCLLISFATICFICAAFCGDKKVGPDDVLVKIHDKEMPEDENKRSEFLWGFANKPEESKFNDYFSKDLDKDYALFAKSLVKKAKEQKLNFESLEKLLGMLGSGSTCLPVGAYQTTLKGDLIWIVIMKWGEDIPLNHIRMIAVTQKELKRVAFNTCR